MEQFFVQGSSEPFDSCNFIGNGTGEAQALKKLTLGWRRHHWRDGTNTGEASRVVYITEQVSHPLLVSAYFATCPQRDKRLAVLRDGHC